MSPFLRRQSYNHSQSVGSHIPTTFSRRADYLPGILWSRDGQPPFETPHLANLTSPKAQQSPGRWRRESCSKKSTNASKRWLKIEQSTNQAQKEKLEDQLKREIKKLQRLRDQIKTWAASNDIKDKGPLLEQRRLIETKFKAVEKAMKTKAYSKEGLSAATKLDPKEQAKLEASEFLSNMVDELEQQIETLEAEGESIQATMKKGKGQATKLERIAEIERIIERHKWHQGKLELIRRSLENGGVETEQVTDLEESIKYYVSDGMNDDFPEDEGMYDDLNLEEEEDAFGMNQENDKGSSQDTQSIQDEPAPEPETKPAPAAPAGKQRTVADAVAGSATRRPSAQKSPLPTLATVHNSQSTNSNGVQANVAMKPAALPTRPAEGLKYASAAAAAAASDKNNVGIAPLPPPPGAPPVAAASPLLPSQVRTSTTNSPGTAPIQPVVQDRAPPQAAQPPAKEAPKSAAPKGKALAQSPAITTAAPDHGDGTTTRGLSRLPRARVHEHEANKCCTAGSTTGAPVSAPASAANGVSNGIKPIEEEDEEEESIYHLPAALQDLVESYEMTKKRPAPINSPSTQRMHLASEVGKPEAVDAEPPRGYVPDAKYHAQTHFPQEPLEILDDPRLYERIDPDTLFYVFYYKQGTYQQYLAARALKDQSWRFHKQYQTWFQRHEEPKSITEEFEQGTYRFFDYESTWMNRRKADFKFAYKFLEDEV
ncbi:Not1 N-terminal domain, CCR4-Not complex component-domain-containing protein [Triangularia setosa]|uniref:General negative regulator of transcription subunit n=1 Tax=Triangularia setosa TaxID=2587417 RepID=A0AAN6W3E3_9PEZI|nr:Not1 N-terminal domain, CCR4-Not complex component-domain-containing protein [Podospora setosa]